jgi:hypothetical protein
VQDDVQMMTAMAAPAVNESSESRHDIVLHVHKYASEQKQFVVEQAKVHRACWPQQAVAVGKGERQCDKAGKIEK